MRHRVDQPELDDDEVRALCAAVLRAHGGDWVEEDELVRAADWAHGVLVQYAMLVLILRGELVLRWDADLDDWRFWHGDEAELAAAWERRA